MIIEKSNLTDEELQKNYDGFLEILKKHFVGERLEKLLFMYSENEMGVELTVAPASMHEQWHNCFPGGYLLHINNVLRGAFIQKKAYEVMGAETAFTDEELAFSAIHHDLGKLGSPQLGSYYVLQDQDWLLKRGETYKQNPNIQYMEVTDRAVFNLQHYGIKITWKEFLGIRLSDGMYNESAAKYLKTFSKDFFLKTNLPRIIHAADYMACRAEYDKYSK